MKKTLALLLLMMVGFFTQGLFAQGINSGNPARPFASNTSYSYGIMPTNLPNGVQYGKSQDAANAYNAWKSNYVRACSGKGYRVLYDDNSSTVSEGVAYGMLLAVYAGDKDLLDGLWQFYNAHLNYHGVMHWKTSSCDNVSAQNGATDAELDVAMALIVANEQWPSGGYQTQALSLISKIRQYEIHPTSYQTINGDAWGFGNDCRNPSYFAPAYYREFAQVETQQSPFWNSTVSATQSFLLTNRNGNTGLVSNWAGSNAYPNTCNGPNEYGFDACRNPWRMATDYIWNGPTAASTASDICGKMADWMVGHETNLRGPLSQSASNPGQGQYLNGTFSTYALAPMGTATGHQNSLNTAYQAVVNLGNSEAYFSNTLRCLTLFMMTGNFWKPGTGGSVTLPDAPSGVTATDGTACGSSTVSWSSVSGATSYKVYKDGTLLSTQTGTSYVDNDAPVNTGGGEVVTAGYSANGCKDDFASGADYALGASGKGLFWWTPADAPGIYTMTRDSVNKKLVIDVDQPKNSYKPFGVSFGDDVGDGTGTPFTADFSGDFSYNLTITNNSSEDVYIRLAAQDIDGNVIDLYTSSFPPANAWKYNIDMLVSSYGSKTLTVGTLNSQSETLTGTFAGGASFDWGTNSILTTFDETQVKGFNITVLSTKQDPVTYEPLALQGEVAITAFEIGVFSGGGTGSTAEYCVEACNANGCSSKSCDVGYADDCNVTIPAAPTGVTATDGTSCDNVTISWTAASTATSYNVYRGGSLIGTSATTSYTDAAAPTSAVSYCVESVNSAGVSATQGCDNGYLGTGCVTPPSTPTGVAATDGSLCDRATITWDNVATATSYKVYRDGSLLGSVTTNSYDDMDAPVSDGGGEAVTAGYSATGCMDDFASPADYALGATGKGLFWWTPADAPGIYTLTRDALNKKLTVDVVQPENSYKPFGVSFGDDVGDGTGTSYTIDCSGDFTYNMTVTNNSGNDVYIRLAAQDIDGNVRDLYTSTFAPANAWKYNIDMLVGAYSSKTLTVGTLNSQSETLTGTFDGGASFDWGTNSILTTFDDTQVKGFNITVLGTLQDPVTYAPLAWNGSVSITEFEIGNFVASGGGTATTANYCVEAVNSVGTSSQACDEGYAGTGCTGTPPVAPTNVSATDGSSCDNVTVTWTESAEATSYKVYRAGTLLGTSLVASYTDASAPTSAVAYCVEAINAAGTSAQACDNGYLKSTGCSVTAPTTPTGVSATDGTICGKATVTWNTVSGATSYKVYRDGSLLGSATSNSYDDTGAPVGGGGEAVTAGYSATGCMDDFASAENYAVGTTGKGLFWWVPEDAPDIYSLTRNTVSKQLDVDVVQPQNSYKPFGASFGDSNGDGSGTPFTIDFSGDFTYQMSVTNNSGNDVYIRLAAQDIDGNVRDLYTSSFLPANAWKYNIDMLVGAYSSKTLTVGTLNSQSETLTGTFDGGASFDWGTNSILTTFDDTQVKGFNITVLSTLQDPVTYEPLAWTGSVSITAFEMGNFVASGGGELTTANYCVEACNSAGCSSQSCDEGYTCLVGVAENDLPVSSHIKVMPNPVTSNLQVVNAENTTMHLYDMFGKVILEKQISAGEQTIHMHALPSGMYMVTFRAANRLQTFRLIKQ